jgi:spermidine synthase
MLARRRHLLLTCCFFLSGATGLIYEVVWSRRLTLTFGATVLAVSTVLAAFFGGLALGSVIFGRFVDRRRDPVRIYALLEGAVGVFCFATPWLFGLVESAYVALQPSVAGQIWPERLLRFGLAAAVLLVPTTLMGGTLPALTRAFAQEGGDVGKRVARLYGINTLGAMVGAGVAGFALLSIFGLSTTVFLAAGVNLLIMALALGLNGVWPLPAVRRATPETMVADPRPTAVRGSRAPSPAMLWGLYIAYALSGAAALVYEVAWTRVLCLSFGTSTYAFSATLVCFLAGIAIGSLSFATRFVQRVREPLVVFGLLQVLLAASVVALSPVLELLPYCTIEIYRALDSAPGWLTDLFGGEKLSRSFALMQSGLLLATFVVMIVPTFLMGITFPLVIRIATERVGVLGRRLGAVYASNTVGTVVGSFAAGFVLIPLIGVQQTLVVGVALNLLVGLVYVLTGASRAPTSAAAGALVFVAAAAGCWFLPQWNQSLMTTGVYSRPEAYTNADFAALRKRNVVYYRDGLACTVSVSTTTTEAGEWITLQSNGKPDASTGDMSSQLITAHLPLLLHPDPRNVMIVGLASGCTVGAAEQHPEVKQLDCVEIEPTMAEATQFFTASNHNCLADPRLRLHYDDARSYVLTTQEKFDVITAEPTNPWIAGVANLFSREHFTRLRDRLKPGGLVCQWIPFYNLGPTDLACVLRTFEEVFPGSDLWVFPDLPVDGFLIGSAGPVRPDVAQVARRARAPKVASDLNASYLADEWDILGGYFYPVSRLIAALPESRPNTDDRPIVEFAAPLRLFDGTWQQPARLAIELAPRSSLPFHPERIGDGGQPSHSGLLGLTFGERWSGPAEESLSVWRATDTFAAREYRGGLPVEARLAGKLPGCDVEILAWRTKWGPEDPAGTATPADARIVTVNGHKGALWSGPHDRILLEWDCPEQGRTYQVSAKRTSFWEPRPVAEARLVGALACDHTGTEAAAK